ncbi:DUF1385 domain-containing protein [Neobacillus mesonae]|uniref:DUF1385 domain-containing protein n=1 Tax=Neobacillus mesonae TaxID=1193713 RepID=UPI002574380D|nr:DUF1385 domain-containing protein [Neobacillus mesonae]
MERREKDLSSFSKSNVRGGMAGLKSVMYFSDKSKVVATRSKNGEIDVKVIPLKDSKINHISSVITEIPFIRGVWSLIGGPFSVSWKFSVILLSLLGINLIILFFYLQVKSPKLIETTFIYGNYYHYHILFLFGFLLAYSLFIKFTELGKYHGAEHMVDNAYEASNNLSILNVEKYSRVHSSCGTNLFVFIILFYMTFSFISDNITINLLLSFIFGYEVYIIKNQVINKVLKPFYSIGSFLQKYLFTSKPEEKHIKVAIAAYEKIISEQK